MARPRAREGLVEEIGGIRIARRRPPAWLLFLIVAIAAWGLYYLLTFSVTDTGSFESASDLGSAVFVVARA